MVNPQVSVSTPSFRDTSAVQTARGVPAAFLRYYPADSVRRELGASHVEQAVRDMVGAGVGTILPFSYRFAKRVLDIMISAIALILLAPLFIVIALTIWIDSPGPIFFRQERVGLLGRSFWMIKFRTMTDGSTVDLTGGIHKRRGDVRITKVGEFLRATSMDELPQLINVFRGEMSLVGPRPEIASIVREYYEPWQYQRFMVPQGISGWWQVTGRGAKLLREHTADDLHYILHATFWLDLLILCMTVRAVIKREGAF